MSISSGWVTKNTLTEPMKDIFSKAEENMYRKKLSESQSRRNETREIPLITRIIAVADAY
jgi:hypothetical protein